MSTTCWFHGVSLAFLLSFDALIVCCQLSVHRLLFKVSKVEKKLWGGVTLDIKICLLSIVVTSITFSMEIFGCVAEGGAIDRASLLRSHFVWSILGKFFGWVAEGGASGWAAQSGTNACEISSGVTPSAWTKPWQLVPSDSVFVSRTRGAVQCGAARSTFFEKGF